MLRQPSRGVPPRAAHPCFTSMRSAHGPVDLAGWSRRFSVWAPKRQSIAVRIGGRDHPLQGAGRLVRGRSSRRRRGHAYALVLDGGRVRPDPRRAASRTACTAPRQIFDPGRHAWRTRKWRGPARRARLLRAARRDLHVRGDARRRGGPAPRPRRPRRHLRRADAGQPFPGERNWGYDGVQPYAVHEAYGGPPRCSGSSTARTRSASPLPRRRLQPPRARRGTTSPSSAPYFTDRHARRGATGSLRRPEAAGRSALRDRRGGASGSATSTWTRSASTRRTRSRRQPATSSRSCAERSPRRAGGRPRGPRRRRERPRTTARCSIRRRGGGALRGLGGRLHHALHALLTGEREAFLADFGRPEHVARARRGFVYQGQRSPYRGTPHGTECAGLAPARFVSCAQNHDQVGNRPHGERLVDARPLARRSPPSRRSSSSARASRSSSWARSTARRGRSCTSRATATRRSRAAVSKGGENEFIAEGAEGARSAGRADVRRLEALAPARRPARRAPRALPAPARAPAEAPHRHRLAWPRGGARGDRVHAPPPRAGRAREPRRRAGRRPRAGGLEIEEARRASLGAGGPAHTLTTGDAAIAGSSPRTARR